jgi:hypothetical protein
VKYQILSDIIDRLSELGLSLQYGNSTDIAINIEFIDAGWSTGSKRIFYEALIFANEQDNVVYMYEKTMEAGSGAILKAVKDAAKLYGWRFETVINKNKAKYPAGYVPMFFNSALQVHTPQQNDYPRRRFYSETPKKGRIPGGVFGLIGLILLGIVLILLLCM